MPEYPNHRQPRNQRDTTVNPQPQVHLPRELHKPCREHRPGEVIRRKQGGHILRIRQRDVADQALKHPEVCPREDSDTSSRHNPMNIGPRRPCKEEESRWRSPDSKKARFEPLLLRHGHTLILVVGLRARNEMAREIPPIPAEADHASNDDTGKDQPKLSK